MNALGRLDLDPLEAGIVGSEREGLWAFYYVQHDALKELNAWLS